MLKRKIAILIAGGLLGAQAGLAVAGEGPFPDGADRYQYWKPLPAVLKFLAQREAANPNPTGASGSAFPPLTGSAYAPLLPAVEQYLAERDRNINVAGAPGGVFIDDCMKNDPGG